MASNLKNLLNVNDKWSYELLDEFKRELETCYFQAQKANESGDDRIVFNYLSQAKVWERLVRIVSGK